jgi:hypothetical protein
MPKITLTPDEIRTIKEEAVGGQSYAERVSLAFALHLLLNRESRDDYHCILDELNFLEGLVPATHTKPQGKFVRGAINFLFHKHYSSPRHSPRNLLDQLSFRSNDTNGQDYVETTIAKIANEHGEHPDIWPGILAYELTIGGYQDHAGRGLTGEWIVFGKHEENNYYLGLATHKEGRSPKCLLNRLQQNCGAEYPFIFRAAP